jgi:hypothetical protein
MVTMRTQIARSIVCLFVPFLLMLAACGGGDHSFTTPPPDNPPAQ